MVSVVLCLRGWNTGSVVVLDWAPSPQEAQKGRKFRTILSYMLSLRAAYSIEDHPRNKHTPNICIYNISVCYVICVRMYVSNSKMSDRHHL